MIENDYKYDKIQKLKNNSFKERIYSSDNIKKFEKCPYCQCSHFIKFGKYQGIQRYRCKNEKCKKTFSNTTNSVWKYLKHDPEKWFKFIELMAEGYTLEICSKVLEISIVTAFYWRHKLLHAVENSYKPKNFKKIVNVHSYNIQKCYKGSRNKHYTPEQKLKNKIDKLYMRIPYDVEVLIAQENGDFPLINRTDSNSTFIDNLKENVLNITKRDCYIHKVDDNRNALTKLLIEYNKKLPKDVKRTYGFKVYKEFYTHEIKDNIVDRVNGIFVSLKFRIDYLDSWIHRFRGIATKYINHYYNFYALIDSEKKFDYIKIFFKLLKNGSYISTENLILSHPENY